LFAKPFTKQEKIIKKRLVRHSDQQTTKINFKKILVRQTQVQTGAF